MNNFDVLKKMSEENYESFKMFSGDTNLVNASIGTNGWGSITMAVDNATVMQMMNKEHIFIGMFVYNLDEFDRIKEKYEK
jgi:hypothetical protein